MRLFWVQEVVDGTWEGICLTRYFEFPNKMLTKTSLVFLLNRIGKTCILRTLTDTPKCRHEEPNSDYLENFYTDEVRRLQLTFIATFLSRKASHQRFFFGVVVYQTSFPLISDFKNTVVVVRHSNKILKVVVTDSKILKETFRLKYYNLLQWWNEC